MTPHEFHLLYELNRPRDPERDYAGSLKDAEVAELYGLLNGEQNHSR